MDFIQTATKQVDKYGPGKHGFTAGSTSPFVAPTTMNDVWCNNVQQEIVNVIEGAGLAINPAVQNQMVTAINTLIANAVAAANNSDYKTSCRFTTTGNVTLSGLGTQAGGDWPAALDSGDRILVKDNTTGSQNGIFVAAAGAWTRATDAETGTELNSGAQVSIEEGSTLADSVWMLTTDGAVVIGTTPLIFARKDNPPFGINQSWQDVTASRSMSTTYYNTTSKPIMVNVLLGNTGAGSYSTLTIAGVLVARSTGDSTNGAGSTSVCGVVPPGASYVVGGTKTITGAVWSELR